MKGLKTISCLLNLDENEKLEFEEAAGENKLYFLDRGPLTDEHRQIIENSNIIIGNPPAHLISNSTVLEFLQLQSAGAEGYISSLPQGAILANATGAYGLAISEYMVGMIFGIYKKLPQYYANQLQSIWQDMGPVRQITGETVLVLGAGDIGHEFARRMHALGCYTIGIRRRSAAPSDGFDEMHLVKDLPTLLPRADILAMCLPSTSETRQIINSEKLALMKSGATLINVGRGNAVDTAALADALNTGKLYAAALDVTDPEPLPPEHPLWKAKNVYITPHISGGRHLAETARRVKTICLNNLRAFISGDDIKNIVDLKTGYRY